MKSPTKLNAFFQNLILEIIKDLVKKRKQKKSTRDLQEKLLQVTEHLGINFHHVLSDGLEHLKAFPQS